MKMFLELLSTNHILLCDIVLQQKMVAMSELKNIKRIFKKLKFSELKKSKKPMKLCASKDSKDC